MERASAPVRLVNWLPGTVTAKRLEGAATWATSSSMARVRRLRLVNSRGWPVAFPVAWNFFADFKDSKGFTRGAVATLITAEVASDAGEVRSRIQGVAERLAPDMQCAVRVLYGNRLDGGQDHVGGIIGVGVE